MKTVEAIIFLSIIEILLLVHPLEAQTNTFSKTDSRKMSIEKYAPGVIVSAIVKGDSVIEAFSLDMNEDVGIIVQFSELPLSKIQTITGNNSFDRFISAKSKIENEHYAFHSDLSEIESRMISTAGSVLKTANTEVSFEYTNAVNGISLKTKRWVVEEIKKLPYVKKVFNNVEVKALDEPSNKVINADKVWNEFGSTGQGIKIAVIDTGIDYLHPDLGTGFGQNFKVLGGYDFFNNDPDPMDDNGHGTHVAGIIAANGMIKGTAPDAALYAYKVLGKDGAGDLSTVIAGIERALDPDQNINTDDAVDIISMSLGGAGDPDDIVSQAVDNATYAGVICIIAAGNNGAYQTISSPGCARTALTVGATDNNDQIAYFSSRGPSAFTYEIKPDVVAPGYSINSTIMGGGYAEMSGTSMATPHVAGCAALLLQLYPGYTPSMIKSLLMSTAKNVEWDVWTQGNGRVDVYKAAKQGTFISPSSISLGVADLSKPNYTIVDTLWLHNYSSIQKTYSFSVDGYSSAGMDIKFEQTSITVAPGEMSTNIITTVINNNLLPFPPYIPSYPSAYTGKIIATSTTDTLIVPYALIKSPTLNINFDEEPWVINIHNGFDKSYFFAYPGNKLSVLLPSDNYFLHIIYNDADTHIFKYNVIVNSNNIINIERSEAKNHVQLQTLDENGLNIGSSYIGAEMFQHKGSPLRLWLFGAFDTDKYFSDFNDDYLWEWHCRTNDNLNKVYTFNNYLTNGCKMDITQINNPGSFKQIFFKYHINSAVQSVTSTNSFSKFEEYISESFTFHFNFNTTLTTPFIQEFYLSTLPYSNFMCYPFIFNSIYPEGVGTPLLETPLICSRNKSSAEVWLPGDTNPLGVFSGSSFKVGYAVPHWFGKTENTETSINLKDARGTFFKRFFYYSNKDYTPLPDLQFELYDNNGGIVNKGKIYELNNCSIPVSSNKYTLKIRANHYYIQGLKGDALVQLTFDTRITDKNPPVLKSLKVLNDGEVSDFVRLSGNGSISFSVEDENPLSNVELYIQDAGSPAWNLLSTNHSGSNYSANVPQSLLEGFVSLKITATDSYQNVLVYTVNPAFLYGETPLVNIDSPDTLKQTADLPGHFTLWQNYPNPFNPSTTINYAVPEKCNVKIQVFDILGREVSLLVDEERNPGYYSVKFNNVNYASGVYIYRIQAGSFIDTKKFILLK